MVKLAALGVGAAVVLALPLAGANGAPSAQSRLAAQAATTTVLRSDERGLVEDEVGLPRADLGGDRGTGDCSPVRVLHDTTDPDAGAPDPGGHAECAASRAALVGFGHG